MGDSIPAQPTTNTTQAQLDAELQQEQLLRAKYGGLLPKKKLMPRDHKYFDSADWQMGKQQGGTAPAPPLRPKLEPTAPVQRRNSQLGDGGH